MNFLSNLTKNDDAQAQKVPAAKDGDDQAKKAPDSAAAAAAGEAHHKPSKSDLMHSAKVVADAAQSHFRAEPEKFDKAEVAGAAADLLDAAADYAKLDDAQGIGMYVDKAEDYLRHYKGSGDPAAAAKPEGGAQGDADKKADGGDGGLMKMAGDFLKK
ncbi:nodulin-related protein 2-like [Salvia miltiorrhiza]|uniref:nodulin-related protein 2-like n=1 Tax=Salvia miltiorrhiza TaxID=226208 RepID=UPI0025ABF4FA|nr:nodulin-related protein 2-like [Salvia miltiorrhiza]